MQIKCKFQANYLFVIPVKNHVLELELDLELETRLDEVWNSLPRVWLIQYIL